MHCRPFLPAVVLLCWFAGSNAMAQRVTVDRQTLTEWQAEARRSHPTVAAAKARVEAARAAVGAVRLWQDPMVGLGLKAASRSMRMDDGDVRLMAEQQLPRTGLYLAQREKALAAERTSQAEVAVSANMLGLEVAKAALELALADEILSIEEEELSWAERMAANAREKLKDPAANAAEPLRLQSELTQEKQKLAAAGRERLRFAQQLNLLLGRPVTQAWSSLALPPVTDATPAVRNEWQALIAQHPRLAVLRSKVEAAGAEFAIAREERKPMVTVSLESNAYHNGDVRDTMFGVRLSLPWWNRGVYKANEERTRQEWEAAMKDIESAERELGSQAVMAVTEAQNAGRQAAAFTSEVLPDAQKAAQAVENSWIGTKSTLAEVLEARRSLLSARTEQRRFVAAQQAALATLRSLRGTR
jgi:cobalt-zinc-cadmium efflux system outer membrane protein